MYINKRNIDVPSPLCFNIFIYLIAVHSIADIKFKTLYKCVVLRTL